MSPKLFVIVGHHSSVGMHSVNPVGLGIFV